MKIDVAFQRNNTEIDTTFHDNELHLGETFSEVITIPLENDHANLKNRDADDQHPIAAITGLRNELDVKQSINAVLTNMDIENILRS